MKTLLGKLSVAATTIDAITIWILGFISSPKFPIWDKPLPAELLRPLDICKPIY
jgi:hypothetical protein